VLPKRSNHRAAHVVIDTSAYQHNLERVLAFTPYARVMAVIKADGYGHGMEKAAEALAGADEFGVTDLDDVWRLRSAGIDKNLTLLSSSFDASDLASFSAQRVRPVIYDLSQLPMLGNLAESASLDLWLKIDTGMGRLGLSVEDANLAVAQLSKNLAIKSLSVMTHLANADKPDHPANKQQFKMFSDLITAYKFKDVSILNSAGVAAFSSEAYDLVRPGLMLYGISPLQNTSALDLDLRPVMSFRSKLISVKQLPAGSSIGYGSTYSLNEDTRIGVISAGYGDGYPRHAPNGTPVVVNDMVVPLIGRVSMDMICVDLSDVNAQVGDAAILWGEDNPVENVAGLAGSIAYELTCGITQRVERIVI